MIKKLLIILMCLFISMPLSGMVFVHAEEDEPTPLQYCNMQDERYDKAKCAEYMNNSQGSLKEISQKIKAAKNNLEEAQKLATAFAAEAEALTEKISELDTKISELEVKIEELTIQIETNEKLVEDLNNRVLDRMVEAQKTMHFNQYLEFILSSNGFDDMLRRIYGIKSIMAKEEKDRETLIDVITKLESDKAELDVAKAELDESKKDMEEKQLEYIYKHNYYLEIQEEIRDQIEELQNQQESLKNSFSSVLEITGNISDISSSTGLASPVPNSSISAGFPYYPASFGGGVHLGVDYAVGMGHEIYAPANGVVIVSSDTCPSVGYLGNSCGASSSGGVSYGGNQVYLICSATNAYGEDVVYAVTFSHLMSGSPTSLGLVMQGDYIGKVGSSGNSTGAHCHIELYFLGYGDMSDIQNVYLRKNYSSSFNCGWGYAALNNTCDNNGYNAPCRLNPANYFGK